MFKDWSPAESASKLRSPLLSVTFEDENRTELVVANLIDDPFVVNLVLTISFAIVVLSSIEHLIYSSYGRITLSANLLGTLATVDASAWQ